MNIIEIEDEVKGLPDEVLIEKAQNPDGNMPTFLVVSELQRRKDMRQRHQAQKGKGRKPTVKDQVLAEGIASLQPQPAQQSGMPATPGGMGNDAGEPMMRFAEGGLTSAYGRSATSDAMLEMASRADAMGASQDDIYGIANRYLPAQYRTDRVSGQYMPMSDREQADVVLRQRLASLEQMPKSPAVMQEIAGIRMQLGEGTGQVMRDPGPSMGPPEPGYYGSGIDFSAITQAQERGVGGRSVGDPVPPGPQFALSEVQTPNIPMRPMPGAQVPNSPAAAPSASPKLPGILAAVPRLSAQSAPPSAPMGPSTPESIAATQAAMGEGRTPEAAAPIAMNPADAAVQDYQMAMANLPGGGVRDTGEQQDVLAQRRRGLLSEADSIAKRYLSEAEAAGEKITEQAKDDAFNLALMSLGVGIGRGDLIGGLEQAGARATKKTDAADKEARQLRKEAEQAAREERRYAKDTAVRLLSEEMNLAAGDAASEAERATRIQGYAAEQARNTMDAMVRGATSQQEADLMLQRFNNQLEEAKLRLAKEEVRQGELSFRKAADIAAAIVSENMQAMNQTPEQQAAQIKAIAAQLMADNSGSPENMETERPPLTSIFND